jgi:23S rRNA (uracil1939-C5)-methyltransferase
MSAEGQGVGRIEGLAVFVAGAVIGDTVRVEIAKVKKNYAFGRLVGIIEPSAQRVAPPCAYYGSCGGCSLQSMSYEGQLEWKRRMTRDRLVRIGGVADPTVHDTIGMERPWRYRNKAGFPVGAQDAQTGSASMDDAGRDAALSAPAVGFYRAKSRLVVNVDDCPIQSEPAMALARALRGYMRTEHVSAYDEKTGKGLIRHLVVKTAVGTGEVMAVLVVNGKKLPNAEKPVYMMDDAVDGLAPDPHTGVKFTLESVILNDNEKRNTEIMGVGYVTLAGKPTISERIGGLNLEISPGSFLQVNPLQMLRLYDKALEYAGLTGAETLLDLYCGVGSIGLYCASRAKKVVGIESVKSAVLDANRNAVINGVVNAEFICGKAEDELPKLTVQGLRSDIMILDPPRAGCGPTLLDALPVANPERIVYISCDPATLARDIKILTAKGFSFAEATPVDMFPHTPHVENIVLLRRRDT